MTAPPADRPLWRTYLAFVGPMVLANILQSLSGTVNGIYVGQMLGTRELAAVAGIDALLAKVPAVSGSGAQQTPGLDNDAVRLLDQAEQLAAKAGDGYVTVERLLLAMVLAPSTPVGKAFADADRPFGSASPG